MLAFLAEWGLEILFAVISAIVVGFVKYKNNKIIREAQEYKDLLKQKQEQEQEYAFSFHSQLHQ